MWFESNLPNIPIYHALVHILRQFGAIKLNSFLMRVQPEESKRLSPQNQSGVGSKICVHVGSSILAVSLLLDCQLPMLM